MIIQLYVILFNMYAFQVVGRVYLNKYINDGGVRMRRDYYTAKKSY